MLQGEGVGVLSDSLSSLRAGAARTGDAPTAAATGPGIHGGGALAIVVDAEVRAPPRFRS